MSSKYSKSNVMTTLIWKLLERGGTQGIQFIIQIVLGRLLLPKDFGLIAIVMVFISLANVFVQGELNKALVQKKDSDSKDFSSVLYVSLMMTSILYVIIYLSAPYISIFYDEIRLTNVLRVISLTLFFGASNSIQNAYVEKHMLFRKLFFSSLLVHHLGDIKDKKRYTADPSGFLDHFNGASMIFTDSFHGCVFSILFKKPFVVFNRGNMNSRIDTLLSKFKFENRHWEYVKEQKNFNDIDYSHVKKIINEERKKPFDYLRNIMGKKKEE